MKQKSLRQLARELGVSVSYLSQVRNGKRPASQKVLSSVKQNVKQGFIDTKATSSYNKTGLPSCVMVAQRTLNPPVQVRALARQPTLSEKKREFQYKGGAGPWLRLKND